jgi:hypothetical protein
MKRNETMIDLICVVAVYALMSLFVVRDLPRTAPYLAGFLALHAVYTVRLERQVRALKAAREPAGRPVPGAA